MHLDAVLPAGARPSETVLEIAGFDAYIDSIRSYERHEMKTDLPLERYTWNTL